MRGKVAKTLRRQVRDMFGMETMRIDGVDQQQIARTDEYQPDQRNGSWRSINPSRAIYRRSKRVYRQLRRTGKISGVNDGGR